jgi:hypothetical protein
MAKRFPRFEDGDELQPWILNMIFEELDRWREMSATGGLGVDNADGSGPPVICDYRDDAVVPAQLTAPLATGTIASPSSATMTLLVGTRTGAGLAATGKAGVTIYNFWPLAAPLTSGTNILAFSFAGKLYLLQVGC